MAELPHPAEFLELADRHSATFQVVDYVEGTCMISPKVNGVPTPKQITCIRITVTAQDKPMGLPYWDISSQRVAAMIRPLLPSLKGTKKRLKITAFGSKPSTQFQVEVV